MPGLYTNAILNQVTLPTGTTYDLNDKTSLHLLGTSLTDVTANSGSLPADQVDVGTSQTPKLVTVSVNDVVIYGTDKLLYLCTDVVHTTDPTSSTWVCISPNTASGAITGVTIGSNTNQDTASVGADHIANFESIHAENIRAGALATGMTATTPTDASADGAIATKKYVDDAIEPIANPMIFIGGAEIDEKGALNLTASAIKVGFTYKITTVNSNYTEAGGTVKSGDTIIAKTATPTVAAGWETSNDWVIIPSGDEPSGTVTQVNTGIGLDGGPINTTGTIKVALNSETALSTAATTGTATDRVFSVVLDSNNKLAVAVPKGTLATTVSDASAGTAVTGVTAPEAGTASVSGNIVYCNVAEGSTTLTFNYIKVTTAADVVFNHAPTQGNG